MSPKLNSFKDRERRFLLKNKGLVSELKATWGRKIPPQAAASIPWMLVQAVTSDLSSLIPEAVSKQLDSAVRQRSVRDYINLQQLASPQQYRDARSYSAVTCCLNLLKKYPWEEGGLNPEAKARERFFIAEKRCKITNARLRHYRQFDFSDSRPLTKRLDVHQVFHLARKKIQNWLGPVDPSEIFSLMSHGPGGCVGQRRPFTTPYYKFGVGEYTVSTGAYWHAVREIAKCDSWVRALAQENGLMKWEHSVSCIPSETKIRLVDQRASVVDYNEVTFVPKDAKTLRSIAIEPRLNVLLQLSVGAVLKKRLAAAGCDLTDQTRNQELARIGSLEARKGDKYDPVTIDLEMASDTLSIELVRELLPGDWFALLDSLRSREGLLDRSVNIKWEKFSSMGNGFTFELESLIFFAMAQTISDLQGTTQWFIDTFGPAYRYAYVSVFGDDIIVPQLVADPLIKILRFCGFQTNLEKTFLSGLFRESCGKDYFDGVPVRVFLLTRKLVRFRDLIHLLNGLRKMSKSRDLPLTLTLRLVESLIPQILFKNLRGWTETDGDEYIWREPDECHSSRLVVYDTDHQNWMHPIMRSTATIYRGRMDWRYCQFLYAQTGMRLPVEPTETYESRDAFRNHRASGGSAGDVVRSGQTQPAVRLTI